MATPQAVLDAEAEADRLIAQMTEGEGKQEDKPESPEESTPDKPVETDEPEEKKDDAPAPVAEENQKQDDTEAKLAELQEKLTKLQAAHDTLKGKTYAEVPRVMSENKALRDRIAELENQISQAQATQTSKPMGKAADILKEIKEDVSENVAEKILKLVEAVTDERVTPVVGRVENLQRTAAEVAEERYLNTLSQLVPDWRDIAPTQEYAEFLQGNDEFSGGRLYDMAKVALNNLDAHHMAKFFNAYKKKNATVAAPAKTVASKGKEALVAPKQSVVTTERKSAEKPDYISIKEMERFAKERKSMPRDKEEQMEARIDKAIQNGWIVQ